MFDFLIKKLMDEIKRIAEDYLRIASCDVEGYLYPNQICISKTKLREVLTILTPFGKEISGEQNGATPIYKINENGRSFIAAGVWSEIERKNKLEEERHKEILEISRKNNKYVLCGIVTTILIGIAGIVVSTLLYKGIM